MRKKLHYVNFIFYKALHHPNIVSCYDAFYYQGDLCVVMDYCEGGDLNQYKTNHTAESSITETHIVQWLVQICLGLDYIHGQKVIHRDLKAHNIFLSHSGLIRIGDFGVARLLDKTTELASSLVGTPYYLSPEMIHNEPYGYQSDMWSLGCVLYELVCHQRPFESSSG